MVLGWCGVAVLHTPLCLGCLWRCCLHQGLEGCAGTAVKDDLRHVLVCGKPDILPIDLQQELPHLRQRAGSGVREGCELPRQALWTHCESHCCCRAVLVNCVHVHWATPTNDEAKAHCITLHLKGNRVWCNSNRTRRKEGSHCPSAPGPSQAEPTQVKAPADTCQPAAGVVSVWLTSTCFSV